MDEFSKLEWLFMQAGLMALYSTFYKDTEYDQLISNTIHKIEKIMANSVEGEES